MRFKIKNMLISADQWFIDLFQNIEMKIESSRWFWLQRLCGDISYRFLKGVFNKIIK